MADYGTKKADKKIKELEKRIEEEYNTARKEIGKKINDFDRKFKIKYNIWKDKLSKGEITQEEYDKWYLGQMFQSQQWRAKEKQICGILHNANSEAMKIINGGKISVFADNANWTSYTLEHGAGINFGFGLYDETAVTQLLRDNPNVLPKWKVNEEKDYVWNKKKVNSVITQGIVQGKKPNEISKDLASKLSAQNMNLMKTHARTAMTAAQNAGRYQSLSDAKDLGIDVYKEWMATLDGRTRDSHRHMDGEKQKVGDKWHPYKFSNGCRYPGDPEGPAWEVYNCRCTLVGDIDGYPEEYERRDNIEGKPIKNMTYDEWYEAKGGKVTQVNSFQSQLGNAKTVEEVNDLMNSQDWWRVISNGNITMEADLTGVDLDSAKSIAASYQQVYEKYPQLKGKFDGPNAHPKRMSDNTYAWCYLRDHGRVQVNPIEAKYGNWKNIQKAYEHDVLTKWHPYGTTAESIVTHEIGHAIDGLLAREGILGGVTSSGQYRYASSTMKNTIMKRAAKQDQKLAQDMALDKMWGGSDAIKNSVSRYAAKNNQEWFAECFAEYITSANPRIVAREFGKELEKLIGRMK